MLSEGLLASVDAVWGAWGIVAVALIGYFGNQYRTRTDRQLGGDTFALDTIKAAFVTMQDLNAQLEKRVKSLEAEVAQLEQLVTDLRREIADHQTKDKA